MKNRLIPLHRPTRPSLKPWSASDHSLALDDGVPL